MEITRNVVLDLLPLYVAGEASADTRALVEKYLATDSEAADIAKELARTESAADVPVPLKREDAMEAYREAKKYLFWRTVVLAAIGAGAFLAVVAFIALFFFRSM